MQTIKRGTFIFQVLQAFYADWTCVWFNNLITRNTEWKKNHQFLLLKLKMKLLNQSDSSFVPQPLTKQLSNASHWSWRHPQYTQASTWLLEVACWKYVESIWKKYSEWSIWTNTSTDKKYLKYQNTKYSICSISSTKYKIQKVFQIRIKNISISNTAHLCINSSTILTRS